MDTINKIKDMILSYFTETLGKDSKTYQIINARMESLHNHMTVSFFLSHKFRFKPIILG